MAKQEKAPPIKTWSEIKLRNPDPKVCQQIELIMADKNESTASKALERYILEYSAVKNATADLRSLNMKLRADLDSKDDELQAARKRLQQITEAHSSYLKLVTAPPLDYLTEIEE